MRSFQISFPFDAPRKRVGPTRADLRAQGHSRRTIRTIFGLVQLYSNKHNIYSTFAELERLGVADVMWWPRNVLRSG